MYGASGTLSLQPWYGRSRAAAVAELRPLRLQPHRFDSTVGCSHDVVATPRGGR